ncbi:hypothetical protein Dsin_031697 [Dipteronia sinensis]|uniref:CLAVATA3/ESR (CLE)-related protein 44 n=1 Tax=Dipteronia sinensis TaxID=43782 RepID=A0AAE0DSC6_9ROSI|nr:hypothetical protein Dsin_031697 [Dipteronia sinensis]
MNRFQFYCLFVVAAVTLLLVFTSRIQAARTSFPSPATRNHHHLQHQQKQQEESTFQPSAAVPISSLSSTTTTNTTREFESQKRRVPTGSNPLHNKRR